MSGFVCPCGQYLASQISDLQASECSCRHQCLRPRFCSCVHLPLNIPLDRDEGWCWNVKVFISEVHFSCSIWGWGAPVNRIMLEMLAVWTAQRWSDCCETWTISKLGLGGVQTQHRVHLLSSQPGFAACTDLPIATAGLDSYWHLSQQSSI